MSNFDRCLLVAVVGFVVTFLFTPLVRKVAHKLKIVDLPNERRPHKIPTPRAGGVAVFLGVHAACLAALLLPRIDRAPTLEFTWYAYFCLASLVIFVTGLVDDCRGLRPLVKLAGQVAAAGIACLAGTRFGNLLGLELPPFLDVGLVIVWLVLVMNAFNLIDGLDGLASGLAAISALGLCGVFAVTHLPGNVLLLAALVGASLAFLRYNFHPASIFLGDSGSLFLGFTLGVVSLQTFTKSTFLLSLTIPILVLGVPIYDELLAIWRRSIRRVLHHQIAASPASAGLMQPDLEHVHHRLVKAGLSTSRAALVLCAVNAFLVLCGLLLVMFRSRASGIYLVVFLAAVYVLLRHLAVIELRDTGRVILNGLRRPSQATIKILAFPSWDMFWMCASVAAALASTGVPAQGFWRTWFLDLPLWVTPTFSLLAISRVYITVWSRARMLDVLLLTGILQGGLLLSVGISLLIAPSQLFTTCIRALLVASISHPAVIGLRVLYLALQEIVIYLRNKSELDYDGERILLYGSGARCQLFLKERGLNTSASFDDRVIVGLMDDAISLHHQWVYGYQVLGSSKDLPQLAARHRIKRVIIVADLSASTRDAIRSQCAELGLNLSEWQFEDRLAFSPSDVSVRKPASSTKEGDALQVARSN